MAVNFLLRLEYKTENYSNILSHSYIMSIGCTCKNRARVLYNLILFNGLLPAVTVVRVYTAGTVQMLCGYGRCFEQWVP